MKRYGVRGVPLTVSVFDVYDNLNIVVSKNLISKKLETHPVGG